MSLATPGSVTCSVCSRSFEPRFSYQREKTPSGTRFYCSQGCRVPELDTRGGATMQGKLHTCQVCGERFEIQFAFQLLTIGGKRLAVCSALCKSALTQEADRPKRVPRAIAVMNQKGGTGKTTTSVSVAAGLAERGAKVLLIDLDPQGNVGVSLGVRGPKSLTDVLIHGLPPEDAAVPLRANFDVITSDQSVAAAEIELVGAADRVRVLRRRAGALISPASPYDWIILDCAPSLSILNQNALTFAREVIVPVSCDYLALVGVKQILRTLRHVNETLQHPVQVLGVLPTFYDVRNRISADAITALKSYFKERVLPPIRINARLKEAPMHKKAIFEYAPGSHGAVDYAAVVEWLLKSAPVGLDKAAAAAHAAAQAAPMSTPALDPAEASAPALAMVAAIASAN